MKEIAKNKFENYRLMVEEHLDKYIEILYPEKISLNKPQNKIIIFASQLYRHAIYQP